MISIRMSKRKKILNMLKEKELTANEIQDKTGFNIELIWCYLSQLKNDKKIKKVGKRNNSQVCKAIKEENNPEKEFFLKYIKENKYIKSKNIAIEYILKELNLDDGHPDYSDLLYSLTMKFSRYILLLNKENAIENFNKSTYQKTENTIEILESII